MTSGRTLNPISIAAVNAIHAGRVEDLQRLRAADTELSTARLSDGLAGSFSESR
jgi:hypothetical protein